MEVEVLSSFSKYDSIVSFSKKKYSWIVSDASSSFSKKANTIV